MISGFLRENLFPQWLWRLPPGSRSVALTFDDGPHPETTPALLQSLHHYQITATHFVLGGRCTENSGLLRDLAESGQCVANHGFQHIGFTFLPPANQKHSILSTDAAIKSIINTPSRYFRPPFGRFNPWTMRVLRQTEHRGAMWSVMIADWIEQSEDELWRRLKSSLHDGAIIVLHDGQPTTDRVVRLLPRLADEISRRGWNFALLPAISPTSVSE